MINRRCFRFIFSYHFFGIGFSALIYNTRHEVATSTQTNLTAVTTFLKNKLEFD